jgi:L-asparaginase
MGSGRVAVIGTGGTISALGRDPFDLYDYDANGQMMDAGRALAECPRAAGDPEAFPVPFMEVSSTRIAFPEWRGLVRTCGEVAAANPGLAGIVVLHGTASLEETAWFLHLTVTVDVPVVVVGAQRPFNGLSSDAQANLRNAIRVAADPGARGMGVLVLLNDEIHSARDVAKSSTLRLHAFRSPVYGPLGQADPDEVVFYRRLVRRHAPGAGFEVLSLDALPRVDILYSYTGGDDVLARAAVDAGARGIVSAGFAPGSPTADEAGALREAAAAGVVVVQSTRAGSGRVPPTSELAANGFVGADDLTPQKARILLALALTRNSDVGEIRRIFRDY